MGGVLTSPIVNKHVERYSNSHVRAAISSMQGYRMDMEDAHNVVFDVNSNVKDSIYFGVYDGHGGSAASLYLQQNLPAYVSQLKSFDDDNEIVDMMMKIDEEFLKTPHNEHGTTSCFVLCKPRGNDEFELITVNVGDSRAMLIHPDGTYTALSNDHKPEDEIERQRIIHAEGMVHANRVDGNLALSRAIGDSNYKNNKNLAAHQQKVIPVPDFTRKIAKKDDILVVCCDGIFEQMSYEEVTKTVLDEVNGKQDQLIDLGEVCNRLLTASLEAGSKDNHTAIIVQFLSDENKEYANAYPAKQFYPGPYHQYAHDNNYREAYKKDLIANNLNFNDELETIKKYEEENGLPTVESNDRGAADHEALYIQQMLQFGSQISTMGIQNLTELLGSLEDEDQDI